MATLNTTANMTQITAPRVPLIDERTGLVSREWYRFFLSLYNLTGSGQNNTTLTDLQVGPPPAQQENLTGLVINIESLKTQPNQESALEHISELEKQIQGLATAIGCPCNEVAAELQKQIDALNVVPLPNISASLTSGTSILYGNGSGGFSNVAIGSGISFSGGMLSATGTGGTVTSVSGTGAVNGITLTGTVTSSGSLTLGGTLSGIANAQLTNSAVTINGVSTSLGGSVSVGTVTNVAAITLGTTGTNLSSTVATGTTTPVITLNVPTASAANRGALSAADWTTFNNKQAAGTYVNSVGGTAPVVSSGGTAPVVSLAANYGDTQNPYASKTANFVLAAPNGGGNPTFRAIVAADIPTLNQNTTGNAATVTTNANLTGAVTSVGNATSLGSFTSAQLATALTNETGAGAAVFATSPTLVTPALGTPSSGIVTNLTGTASININGTVGATTAAAGLFTTLSASSATFATPLALAQGGTGNTTGNVASSQVAGALNATGSAPLFACRAWVNFDGTGTVAIRASGNVSSITDNGVGSYNVNFTTAMPDVNYAVCATANNGSSFIALIASPEISASTSSSARINTARNPDVFFDGRDVDVAIFR